MKAVVIYEHGDLDKLSYVEDFPDPEVRPCDVLIRIKAMALNYLDIFTRKGMPGISVPFPMITGGDMAGEIVEIGAKVSGLKVGQRVLVNPINFADGGMMGEKIHGGMCELVRARPEQLFSLPDNVSFEEAACLPVAYGTAHRMMHNRGEIKPGEKVLVLGASGGVGTACVQLGKMIGAEIIVCASSSEKLEKLKKLGADHGINYKECDFPKAVYEIVGKPTIFGGGGVDVVINFTGGDTWIKSLKCLKRQGRMLTCGATAGFNPTTDLRYIWSFEHKIIGSNGWMPADLDSLLELVSSGQLKPLIDRVMPLKDAQEAERLLEERKVSGKVVLLT